MQTLQLRYATAILQTPTGRFMIVGSVPQALYDVEAGRPKVFPSEDDAIEALLRVGIVKFQRADCSWFDGGAR